VFQGLQSTVTNITLMKNTGLAPRLNLSEFAHLSNLQELTLHDNQLEGLVSVRPLPNLVDLRLYNNRFRDLPQTCLSSSRSPTLGVAGKFPQQQQWKAASSRRNQGKESEDRRSSVFPKLRYFDMRENEVGGDPCTDFDPCLPALQTLDFSLNRFTMICENAFSRFPALQDLRLDQNRVELFLENAFTNKKLKSLTLRENRIRAVAIDKHAFNGCQSLESIDFQSLSFDPVHIYFDYLYFNEALKGIPLKRLTLSGCGIPLLENPAFPGLRHLEELVLSGNRIGKIPDGAFDSLENLTRLYLHDNKITEISEKTFGPRLRERLDSLTLGQNPFHCSCDVRWLRGWLRRPGRPFNASNWNQRVFCDNVEGLRVVDFAMPDQACILSKTASSLIITACTLFILTFTLVLMLSRYRWHLRLLLYEAFRGRHVGRRQQYLALHHFRFDVFVSYASQDSAWVHRHLMPQLEGRAGLRLCDSERDFVPGQNIVDNIAKCVAASKKVLMVFSPHFARSPWCQFELTFCLSHVMDVDDALVIVMLDDVEARDMTSAMMAVLKTTTYIEWARVQEAQRSFWQRMRIALQEVFMVHNAEV
jgi:Leucine-rich repeat (LRR) protein